MTSNWKEYKIADLGEIKTGKTPKTSIQENYGGNIPFLTPSDDMSVKYVKETVKKITESGLKEVKSCLLPAGSICVSCIGSDLGKVVITTKPTVTNQQINSIIVDTEQFDTDFCYYLMVQLGKLLNYHSKTSTAVPIINKTNFSSYGVRIPDLETQQKIAKILSAIDDKIELNNSINNNLEQQAQAIFKENISKNCNNSKNGCIGDYCAVKSGFAFKGSWWQNTGIKVIKIKTIDNDNINFNDCSYVSEDKIQYAKDFIVKGGDLLIAMTGATIGKFAIVPKVNETILVNQRVGKFFLGENPVQNLPFLYCTLKEQDVINEIINKGQGSAQPNISGSDIMNTLCYFPEKQNIVDFNNLCTPIFEKIINNKYENYHLIKLRDTLLPKLMSGEIDVSNVDISADKLLFSEEK